MNDKPKKKRRGILILLFLLVFIVVLVGALPLILSSSAVRSRVVDSVNADGAVTLQVEDWSLGWVGPQQVEGLSIKTKEGLSVQVPHVTIHRGLIGLLRTRDARLITIDQPRIVLPAPKPSAPPPSAGTPAHRPSSKPAKPVSPAQAASRPGIPITGILEIENGTLALTSIEQGVTPVLENITTVVQLPASLDKVKLNFSATASGGGNLVMKGQVSLPGDGVIDLNNLPIKGDVHVDQLQLTPYLEWASGMETVPRGEGVLDLHLEVDGNTGQGINLEGALIGTGIRLSGGALGKDEPAFDKVTVDLDGRVAPSGISFRTLKVESPVLQVNASGEVDESGDGNFDIKAVAQLAEIFVRFPHTLKLREGMAVNGGQLTVEAGIKTAARQQQVNSVIKLEGLQGVMDGQAVALSEPVHATIKGEQGPRGIRVDQLEIVSSFLQGKGSGTPEDFNLNVNADLPAALAEAGKFIDVAPWSAAGQADLTLSMKDREDDRRDLTGKLSLTNFALKEGTNLLVPEQRIQVDLRAETDKPADRFLQRIHQGQLILQSGFGNGRVAISNLVLPEGEGPPAIEKIKVGAQLNLAQLNPLLNKSGESPMKLNGKAGVSGDFALANQVFSFKDLEVALEDFQVNTADQQITLPATIKTSGSFNLDPEVQVLTLQSLDARSEQLTLQAAEQQTRLEDITVSTAAKVDLTKRSLNLSPSTVSTRAFTLNTGALVLPDWDNPLDVRGNAKLVSTLEALWQMRQSSKPPARGQLNADLELSGMQAAGQTLAFTSTIEDLVYAVSEQETIREKQVALSGKLVIDEKNKNIRFSELALQSTPLKLSAQGHLNKYDTSKDLEARGSLAVDLDQLAPYLRPVIDEELVMKGRTDRPFEILLSLGAEAPAESTRGFASLHADELSLFGLSFLDLDLPMHISNNVAQVALTATANEGKVEVRPGIDLGVEPKSLSIPEDSRVLDHVKLTSRLADALLGRIHPLFKGASVVGGQVSMTLDNFDMPLGAGKQNDMKFAGTLHLHEVELGASGMLEGVLNLIKIKEKGLNIGDRDIQFKCENGRIATSPTQIKVEGYELVLEGSVGFDQTLDYAAKVPVTEDMVGSEAFAYVKGTQFSLPIGGTVSRPKLDEAAFRNATSQLIKDATRQAIQNKAGELLEGLFK